MSGAAKIDFENYFALFVTSLERFSIPGLGSFVWHIERVEVDPKAAQIKPPRPQLKYEPGQRYLSETIAFLIDKYGLSQQEAEAFLKELGLILVNYLKATNEMDVWKLGKLRRTGVSYRLELNEGAPVSFLEDLHPVSLRHGEGAVAPISGSGQSPASPPPPKKAEKEKPSKESSRAKAVDVPPQPQERTPARRRGLGWIVAVLLLLVGIGVGAYFILRQRKKASRQPVEIVLGSKNEKKSLVETSGPEKTSEVSPAESTTPTPTPSPAPENKPSSTPAITEKTSTPPAPAPEPPVSERPTSAQPTLTTPQKGRYYIIIGSEPSLEAAYAKAKALGVSKAEFLPVPERGRVRISYHSTPNKAEAEARLKDVKARIPDAWIYTP